MTTVWPNSSTARRSSSSTSRDEPESRLPVGSSAKMTAGRETSARATATRCCWPPESSDGRCVEPVAQPDGVDQLVDPLLVGLAAGDRQRQQDVLLRGEDRQQVERLEDEADLVAAQLGQRLVVERRELVAVDLDGPRRRAVEPGEDVHQRRLAGARRPHDGDEAALVDVDVDAVEGVDHGLAGAVGAV